MGVSETDIDGKACRSDKKASRCNGKASVFVGTASGQAEKAFVYP